MSKHRHVVERLYAEVVAYQKDLEADQERFRKAQEHVTNLMVSVDGWRRMIADHRAAIAILEADA